MKKLLLNTILLTLPLIGQSSVINNNQISKESSSCDDIISEEYQRIYNHNKYFGDSCSMFKCSNPAVASQRKCNLPVSNDFDTIRQDFISTLAYSQTIISEMENSYLNMQDKLQQLSDMHKNKYGNNKFTYLYSTLANDIPKILDETIYTEFSSGIRFKNIKELKKYATMNSLFFKKIDTLETELNNLPEGEKNQYLYNQTFLTKYDLKNYSRVFTKILSDYEKNPMPILRYNKYDFEHQLKFHKLLDLSKQLNTKRKCGNILKDSGIFSLENHIYDYEERLDLIKDATVIEKLLGGQNPIKVKCKKIDFEKSPDLIFNKKKNILTIPYTVQVDTCVGLECDRFFDINVFKGVLAKKEFFKQLRELL